MCDTCGCSSTSEVKITKPGHEIPEEHHHEHGHDHSHSHEHDHSQKITIDVNENILQSNNLLAERNRGFFEAKNILSFNLVSSPGAGKTCLLEKTIRDLKNEHTFFVIEGDQQTLNDAERIEKTGAGVIQVNTGSGCHLEAKMVHDAVKKLNPVNNSVLFIENVGNLVCPALFDLGEKSRIIILSVTEGEDKPLKYPYMFTSANLCIINKTDLLPYLDFDIQTLKENILHVNHHMEIIELSVKSGEGLENWYAWLKNASQREVVGS